MKQITYEITDQGCWNCTSHYIKPNGYPLIVYKGKRITMSRYMYLIHKGNIPKGLEIRHKCDNRKCINPDHLEIGTHSDNMQDMIKRDRRQHQVGIKNPNAKLKESIVIRILKLYKSGLTQKVIANKCNIDPRTVNKIIHKKTWKHINLGGDL
jgi:hypothetical protein